MRAPDPNGATGGETTPEEISPEARAASRGVLALAVLQTLGRAFGLAFALGATRLLTPSEFGRYSTVSGIVLFGGFVADFGTSIAITRWISKDPHDADTVLGGTLGTSLAIGVVTYVGAIGFALLAGYPDATTVDIAIGAVALPLSAVATSLLAVLDGRGMLDRRAAITFVQSGIVGLGGLIALLAIGGVRSAVWMIPVGPLVAGVLAVIVLRRTQAWSTRPSFDAAASRRLLLEALPFAVLAGIAAFTLRFDLVFVSVVSTAAETARYDLALRSVEALTYLGGAIAAPAIFILTRRLSRGDVAGAQRALAEAARFSYLAGIPLSVLLAVLAVPAVQLLYGSEFANVATPLAVLALQLWLVLLVSLLGSAIIAAGLGRRVIPISAGVAAFGVALDVVLVPVYGATGAACAAVGAQLAALIGFVWFAHRRAGLWLTWPAPGVVLAAAAAGGVAELTKPALGLAAALPGAVTYFILLVVLRGVHRRDLLMMQASLRPDRRGLDSDG